MVFASMSVAFAADEYSIVTIPATTITRQDGTTTDAHTFNAVQIFKGTQEIQTADNAKLGDIIWGDDVNSPTLQAAVRTAVNSVVANAVVADADAKTVAKAISEFNNTQAVALAKALDETFKNAGTTLSAGNNVLAQGYYLIVDTTNIGNDDARNASLLQLTRDVTVNVKTTIPTEEKKVADNEDTIAATDSPASGTSRGANYNDVADYNIGDTVPFELLSKVPDMTYYDTYYFAFHDAMDAGLTFDAESITVKINGVEVTGYTFKDSTSDTADNRPTDNDTFCVIFSDLKSFISTNLATILGDAYVSAETAAADETKTASTVADVYGKEFKVTFNAVLNTDAEIGDDDGNKNTSHIEFSNNPDTTGHGESTPDQVIIFTYELDSLKVDGEKYNAALKNYLVTNNLIAEDATDAQVIAKIAELQAGDDTAKDHAAAAIAAAKAAKPLNGAKFVLANADGKLAMFDSNGKIVGWDTNATYTATAIQDAFKANRATTAYDAITPETGEVNAKSGHTGTVTLIMTSNTDGEFSAIGLDEGVYTLTEVLAPVGYNLVAAGQQFTITATELSDRQNWDGTPENAITALTITVADKTADGDQAEGTVDMTIVNNAGVELPETGGIGTTIFYVAGSILVLAAAILLITKRRMGAGE